MMSAHINSSRISVVVIALNEGSNLRRTVENLQSTLNGNSEILVVDDGSDDGCADYLAAGDASVRLVRSDHLGVAAARNFGAAQTSGDIIVFADAHITLQPDWWAPMVELLDKDSVGAVAPVITNQEEPQYKGFGLRLKSPDLSIEWLRREAEEPYPVPILPGCCLAMRRETFEETGGFDGAMIRSGGVDNELALRFWLLGYELWLAPQVEVLHLFRRRQPYELRWDTVMHNKLRLAFVHFEQDRVSRVVEALRGHTGFAAGLARLAVGDASESRSRLASRRVRDDGWFFEQFGPSW